MGAAQGYAAAKKTLRDLFRLPFDFARGPIDGVLSDARIYQRRFMRLVMTMQNCAIALDRPGNMVALGVKHTAETIVRCPSSQLQSRWGEEARP